MYSISPISLLLNKEFRETRTYEKIVCYIISENNYLSFIDRSFALDGFNSIGFDSFICHKSEVFFFLFSNAPLNFEDILHQVVIEVVVFYGMIHANFLRISAGLDSVALKFFRSAYGTCPRVLCDSMPLLPFGFHSFPTQSGINSFCLHCQDVYALSSVPSTAPFADGAFFGKDYIYLFIKRFYDKIVPLYPPIDTPISPKIYGFPLAKHSCSNKRRDLLKSLFTTLQHVPAQIP